jgi:serine/threonine protein kinase
VGIPLETAVAVAVAIASGLHYAHEKRGADGRPLGIVHRDISPHNVILTYEGEIKIIDFGVAKSSNNLTRTRHGVFKGKVAYASPEQCQGELVDRRSDLFSLGVLLFELSTGRVLFPQNNELAVMKAITEGTIPRPSEIDPTYPPALERIVLRAMARERNERYATAQDMQLDLEGFARQHGLDLSPSTLVGLLRTLFRDDVDAWQMAREVSTTLEQHIVRSRTRGRGEAAGEPDQDASAVSRPSETRGAGSWIVVGLSAIIVAAVVALVAPRLFSGRWPSPNEETRLQEAEEDLLKAQQTIREIEDTAPCRPPSCLSTTVVPQ